jgi:DHA1 family bicyclomycin/chloramphenicol resistance-like MFS transporter
MSPLPLQRQRLLACLIMVAVAFMVSSMDIYLPAMPLMRDHFGTTELWMQISLMISPFASALVGILFGRLSDIYGRLPLLFTAFGFFLAGGLGCCFADTMESFFLSRFIQAIGGGGISILGVVVVSDMFHGIQYARYMSIYGSLFPIVFAISPIIGAQATEHFGWRSCFVIVFVGMFCIAATLKVLLPETIKRGEKSNMGGLSELLAKGKMLLKNREFILMALGHSLPITIGGLFSSNASFIFIDQFGYTPILYSLSQAVPIALNFTGAMIYRRYIPIFGLRGSLQIGVYGLIIFTLSALAFVNGLLPNTPLVILGIFCLINLAVPFIIATCATRAFETFPDDRGLSVSVVALTRNLSLAFIVTLAGLFFNGTIFPVFIAMSLVTLCVLGILYMALQRPLAFEASR